MGVRYPLKVSGLYLKGVVFRLVVAESAVDVCLLVACVEPVVAVGRFAAILLMAGVVVVPLANVVVVVEKLLSVEHSK